MFTTPKTCRLRVLLFTVEGWETTPRLCLRTLCVSLHRYNTTPQGCSKGGGLTLRKEQQNNYKSGLWSTLPAQNRPCCSKGIMVFELEWECVLMSTWGEDMLIAYIGDSPPRPWARLSSCWAIGPWLWSSQSSWEVEVWDSLLCILL
jgi:hypothetical protein